MKRPVAFVLALALAACLAGCGEKPKTREELRPLAEIWASYSLADAVEDGCLVLQNGDATGGEAAFGDFLHQVAEGEEGFLRQVNYYTLGDKAQYDPDYYEEIRDEYPKIFVADITFENEKFTVEYYDEGERISQSFDFLIGDKFTAPSPGAAYTGGVAYFLCDKEDAGWNEVMSSALSSQAGAAIPHYLVYCEYEYKAGEGAQ